MSKEAGEPLNWLPSAVLMIWFLDKLFIALRNECESCSITPVYTIKAVRSSGENRAVVCCRLRNAGDDVRSCCAEYCLIGVRLCCVEYASAAAIAALNGHE